DDGLAALLARGDARRRLPLRPGAHTRPPGWRLRQGLGVPGHGVAGSHDVAGQDGCRALGRRPDGQLRPGPGPATVAGNGTANTGTRCGTSGAATRSGSANSPTVSPARPTCTRLSGAGPRPR